MSQQGDPLGQFAHLSVPELRKLAKDVTFYHSLDLGEGVETIGDFDIRPQIHRYGFPEDMSGLQVLDVGRASGYFSFEFERRGATVCTTELPNPLQKDYVGLDYGREIHLRKYSEAERESLEAGTGARMDFPLAHRILGSRVESVYVTAYATCRQRFSGGGASISFSWVRSCVT